MTATQAAGAPRRPGALKPVQWVLALGALVLMVFAVTFALNYLGTGGPSDKDQGPPAAPQLTFAETVFPGGVPGGAMLPPLTQEAGQEGHHDFWFHNDNGDQPVKVGLAT